MLIFARLYYEKNFGLVEYSMKELTQLFHFGVYFALTFGCGAYIYLHSIGILYRHPSLVGGRIIRDVDLVWRHAIFPGMIIFVLTTVLSYFWFEDLRQLKLSFYSILSVCTGLIGGAMMLHFVNVWRSYNFGVLIDGSRDLLDMPASDMAQTISEDLVEKSFFDHAKRESLRLSELESIDNNSDRNGGKRTFQLTISGTFGSRSIEFSCKQKRDECRNAILAEYKKAKSGHMRADINWDF